MKTLMAILTMIALGTSGCGAKPGIRVSLREIKDQNGLDLAWNLAGTKISVQGLPQNHMGPYFWLLLNKKLPLGTIDLTAIKLVGSERKSVMISPSSVSQDDPKANLFGFAIRRLSTLESWSLEKPIEPGEYYIYLSQNNQEIVGETITIIE